MSWAWLGQCSLPLTRLLTCWEGVSAQGLYAYTCMVQRARYSCEQQVRGQVL